MRVDILQHAADDLRYIGERDLAGVVAVNHDGPKERAGVVVGHGARQAGGKRGLAGAEGPMMPMKSPLFTLSEMWLSACSVCVP